jgi:hypothetical protein
VQTSTCTGRRSLCSLRLDLRLHCAIISLTNPWLKTCRPSFPSLRHWLLLPLRPSVSPDLSTSLPRNRCCSSPRPQPTTTTSFSKASFSWMTFGHDLIDCIVMFHETGRQVHLVLCVVLFVGPWPSTRCVAGGGRHWRRLSTACQDLQNVRYRPVPVITMISSTRLHWTKFVDLSAFELKQCLQNCSIESG